MAQFCIAAIFLAVFACQVAAEPGRGKWELGEDVEATIAEHLKTGPPLAQWEGYIDHLREAVVHLEEGPPTDVDEDTFRTIRSIAKGKYPYDYSMRWHVVKRHLVAAQALAAVPSDVPPRIYWLLRWEVREDWPQDYRMQEFALRDRLKDWKWDNLAEYLKFQVRRLVEWVGSFF